MSSFVIKLIAIFSMLLDHSGDALLGRLSFLNMLGRIAFPLFAFQLVIGYSNTHNLKKYLIRLFLFALISQVPYGIFINNVFGYNNELNIFFTLILGILVMLIYDYQPKITFNSQFLIIVAKVWSIFLILLSSQALKVDYGFWGVLLILLIYILYPNNLNNQNSYLRNALFKLSKTQRITIFEIAMFVMIVAKYICYFFTCSFGTIFELIFFTFLPTVFMLIYNGKKGPSMKYFFYLFYPVHLIILDIISFLSSSIL